MDKPIQVEVVAYVLGSLNHCSHCQVFLDGVGLGEKIHRADMEAYPEEWIEEWARLSDLIYGLTEKYAGKLTIHITDAQSPQAIWKSLRHGVRKYPTFMVGGKKYHGLDEGLVSAMIEKHLPMAG